MSLYNLFISFSAPFPNHLWSKDSKFRKSWILFSSKEKNLDSEYLERNPNEPLKAEEIDDYLKAYATNR